MKIDGNTVTITVPGWFWLLLIGIVAITYCAVLVCKTGWKELIFPETLGEDVGTRINNDLRHVSFVLVATIGIVCIGVPVEYFISEAI